MARSWSGGRRTTPLHHHRWQQPPRTPWLPLDMTIAGLRGCLAFAVGYLARTTSSRRRDTGRGNGEHA